MAFINKQSTIHNLQSKREIHLATAMPLLPNIFRLSPPTTNPTVDRVPMEPFVLLRGGVKVDIFTILGNMVTILLFILSPVGTLVAHT